MDKGWLRFLPLFIREKLQGKLDLQKIISNTSWLFADRILRLFSEVFITLWLARYLGPKEFGLYSYALAFVSLFTAVANLGLDRIVVREIVNYPSQKNQILSTALILRLITSILVILICFLGIIKLRPEDDLTQALVLIMAISLIFRAFEVIDFWFQSQVNSKYSVIAQNIALVVMMITRVILIILQAPLIAFAWTILGEMMLAAVNLIIVYYLQGEKIKLKYFQGKRARQLLKDGLPLMLSGIAIMLYMRMDQIMLGQMIGDQAVGVYSVVVKLSESWYFIPMAIALSVFPAILAARQTSETIYYQRLKFLFRFMVGLSYFVAINFSLFSPFFVKIIFGEGYEEAGWLLAIHIWGGVFVCLGVVRSLWLNAENFTGFSFLSTALGALVNVILNYLWIPQFEILGASLATIISQAIAALFACFLFQKTRKIGYLMLKSLWLQ